MNIFNRVMMVLLFLGALAFSFLLTIIPIPLFNFAINALNALKRVRENSLLPWIGAGLAFMLLWLLFLVLELWQPPKRTVKVLKVSGGEVAVTTDAIAQRLEYRVDQLPDIVKVHPRVSVGRGGVDVTLDLETAPDIEVPAKTQEVLAIIKEVVEERMGLRLKGSKVNIRHAPYPKEVR